MVRELEFRLQAAGRSVASHPERPPPAKAGNPTARRLRVKKKKRSKSMLNRRQFLGTLAAGTAAGVGVLRAADPVADPAAPARKRLAVVTTVWTYRSHAWHMAERFLHGFPLRGRWHHSDFHVVSAYVDQKPEGDLSRGRAEEFGFPIYPTIAQTLRCGGAKLAVDAVLIIGEHGEYPLNEFGQKKYPRYE